MYKTLNEVGKQTNTVLDNKKYPCLSIPVPDSAKFYPYGTDVGSFYTKEYFKHPPPRTAIMDQAPKTQLDYLAKTKLENQPKKREVNHDEEHLLPVLDCRFNLREICKQCILLEDHLTHNEKRCHDCCIKHFLALEGLSEEAVTLDKDAKYNKNLKDIPTKIREIQKLWYEDPDKNAHQASQMLREIRKNFQQKVFNIVFDSDKNPSCADGVCKLKKK